MSSRRPGTPGDHRCSFAPSLRLEPAYTTTPVLRSATMRFDTPLASLPLRLTFLCEGPWAFLGVLTVEQLIVDAHGEGGGC